MKITGTGVVPGVAYAPAAWVGQRPQLNSASVVTSDTVPDDQRDAELQRFFEAADAVATSLETRAATLSGAMAEVLTADAAMARDKGWRKAARKQITSGVPAEGAVVAASQRFIDLFTKAGGVVAERVTDLEDIRDRVLAVLLDEPEPGLPVVDEPSIFLAEDLSPADTALLDPSTCKGVVIALGGPTSHTAIVARQLNIPCIVAAGAQLQEISDGVPLLIDAAQGVVSSDISALQGERAVKRYATFARLIEEWTGPGCLADGTAVSLLANVSDSASALTAAQSQAEGIGLYRTEIAFLRSTTEPSISQQTEIYRKVFQVFPKQKVVVRTLDAGSDKPISYATGDYDEENPALGVRGLRVALQDKSDVLIHQLDAITEAAKDRLALEVPTWVMAPMVSTPEEARFFAQLCRERGLTPGVMIEVPAAALLADRIMEEVDFVSLGTNDLTQYVMAADRLSPQLVELNSPWQPALLRLIKYVCDQGIRTQTSVGVCGEAAADPLMACVLAGFGVSSLSCAPAAISAVGAQLAQITLDQCQALAQRVCNATPAQQARREAAKFMEAVLPR